MKEAYCFYRVILGIAEGEGEELLRQADQKAGIVLRTHIKILEARGHLATVRTGRGGTILVTEQGMDYWGKIIHDLKSLPTAKSKYREILCG